jgi:hypothetical protein
MIDEDVEIETSPLSRKIQREGFEIEVLIYGIQGSKEGWTLEVVDEENASTVWDQPFDTDQAALDEFTRVLEEEGISEFLRPEFVRMH